MPDGNAPRVAYIINSLEGGGAALPVPAVLAEMRKSGAQVRLFALSRRDGRAAAPLDAANLDYRVSPAGKANHVRAARWLWREIVAYRPTLLWTSLTQATVIGQIMGAMLRIPVVSWQHNAFLKPANRRLLRLTRPLTRLWIADSSSVAHLTATQLHVNPADVMVWPLFRVDDAAPMARACPIGSRFRLGSLGRLHPNKGYDILIEALALIHRRHPDLTERFEVLIGGEGQERDHLLSLAAGQGVRNLVLAGYQAEPRDFLADLHAYVQPSRAEGLCIAAHEAMQAGLPAIVTEVGEMCATVRSGGGGHVVPPGNPQALAEAIVALVSDHDHAHSAGLKARAHIFDTFGPARFSEAAQMIFRRLEWPL